MTTIKLFSPYRICKHIQFVKYICRKIMLNHNTSKGISTFHEVVIINKSNPGSNLIWNRTKKHDSL
jgi:hypothetical protein